MPAPRSAVLLCLLLFPAASGAQTRVTNVGARTPLTFEENRGQTAADVRFLARGQGYTLFLTPDEAVFNLRGEERATISLRMSLIGGQRPRAITAFEPAEGKSHYLRGRDTRAWVTGVPSFARVRYEEVYPGIALVYYGNQQQLEYDFVVSPGSDASAIALKFAGSTRLRIEGNGDLLLRVGNRDLRQRRPVAYQDVGGKHREVRVDYSLSADGLVGFRVGPYDVNAPLTIDPVLIYSTYWSEEFDLARSVAVDGTGNAYVGGQTSSLTFPTTPGAWQPDPPGISRTEAFVTKFDPAGRVVYSTYLGGSEDEDLTSIAVDASGAAYVVGNTMSLDFPVTAGAFQTQCAPPGAPTDLSCSAGFVTKLNPSGSSLVFSTYLGGRGAAGQLGTNPLDLALAAPGDIVITGATGSGLPATAGVFQSTYSGSVFTGFVARLSGSGSTLVFASFLGGQQWDRAGSIAVDPSGNIYVTGVAASPDFPVTPGAFQQTCRQIVNPVGPPRCEIAFVTKIDSTGSALVYSTFLGGDGPAIGATDGLSSFGTAVAVDRDGFAYVTGGAWTADFPTTAGTLKPATSSLDAFVTKLNLDGSALVYSTYLGGESSVSGTSGRELGTSIDLDRDGNVHVGGQTYAVDFPAVNAIQSTAGGGSSDAFVAQLDASGSVLLFSTYLGGDGDDETAAVAVDASGNLYVAGLTASGDFPIEAAVQPSLKGSRSSFVAKIGEPICGTDVTGQVQVFQSAIVPFFWPFHLQLAIVWNSSPTPIDGPVAYVMDDLQNAVFVGPLKTRCFSPEGDPLTPVPLGDDKVLAPNEVRLMGLWFFQTQLGPISYTPRLLSGIRNY